jgi:hypothetical protein
MVIFIKKKRKRITNADNDVEKKDPYILLVGI